MRNEKAWAYLIADWPAKVLSLAAAIGLFFFYQINRLEERPVSIPLSLIENNDLMPASPYPRTVRLILRGDPKAIFSILEDDLEATLDLSGFRDPGVWRAAVTVEKKGTAIGVSPLEITVEPAEIAISLERKMAKALTVVPGFRGYLASGYELSSFSIEPRTIEVVGPESLVKAASEATTESIELSGRSEDFSLNVQIQKPDPLLSYRGKDYVAFAATVTKALIFRTVEDISIVKSGLPEGLAVVSVLPAGTLRLSGARATLEALPISGTLLAVDLSSIAEPGTYTLAVSPRLPEGVAAESWDPGTVTLTVRRGQGEAFQ